MRPFVYMQPLQMEGCECQSKNSSGTNSTFTFPAGITYPIHLPAGMTVQTASGQLYKVTVPVMVTQAPGGPRLIQQPVQQLFQHLNQSSGQAGCNQYSVNYGQKWQQQAVLVQRSEAVNTYKPETTLERHFENINGDSLIEQSDRQQHLPASSGFTQYQTLGDTFKDMVPPPLFNPAQSDLSLIDNSESVLNSLNMNQTVQGNSTNECENLLKSQVTENVMQLIALNDDLNPNTPGQDINNLKTPEGVPMLGKQLIPNNVEIIQVDGPGDTSSDDELGAIQDVDENEFLGIIDTEDLKALEEEDSGSNEDSTSNSSDDDDPEIDIIEEDPLNSGDDVSEQEVPDLFDTDNVIVCQYDKIHRSKNKWKFYLKDGVMSFGGKDYVFSKAIGEAEW
ncbi:TFIIA-alpha and beta-like factor [Bombina bombina]|uniref:TFIIA-alpha and beta-like factor n=1 Tax=Bombina bombina TaxID=8345 RepID=UPI00235AD59A|nr:TFIIA-alpha and beta-like factor [Bombina bombina]